MKICFLTIEFPHSKTGSSGGIGTSILNLTKGLIQLGHEVSIVIYAQDKDEVFIENGITFYKIKNIKFKGLSLFLSQKKAEKLLNKLVQENKIEIIEAIDWTGFTSFIKVSCPIIIKLHGSDTYFCHLDKRPVKWINKFLEKRALKKCDGILSVSEYTGNLTKQLFNLKSKFTVIPNAVDTTRFESLKSEDDTQNIIYFGTIIRKKGMFELPLIFNEVFKNNAKAKLTLIGTNALDINEKWKPTWELILPLFKKDAFKNVSYLGSVPYDEIKTKIQEASVCVFPTFAEALPVSWLEAMAMKKPIVASNIGWAKEIIDDNINGFLEHPKNHLQFANKIIELLNDKELQHKFGVEARKKVDTEFSIEIIAQRSVEFYKKYL